MAGYHRFVFDEKARRLVGDFDAMYAAEETEGFDSWQSADLRGLRHKISQAILSDYNFGSVLDVGCGKGHATAILKRKNNRVLGVDISEIAIKKALASFPDIEFRALPAEAIDKIKERFDLVTFQGVLAYIPDWRKTLSKAAKMCDYCLVAEYIPPNPIGMVKSQGELVAEFTASFSIMDCVTLENNFTILFGAPLKS